MILQVLYGFLAALGFGIIFGVPQNSLIAAGISGAVGWLGYMIVMEVYPSSIAATFVASVLIGIMGEFFAKRLKNPSTIFIIPGITPLVPGITSYRTIKALIDGNNELALNLAILTVGTAIAISTGLIFAMSFFRIRKRKPKASPEKLNGVPRI